MHIAVVGGTGFIGSRLVTRLDVAGHTVSSHARSTHLDLLTGAGLPEALVEADVVVNTIDAPSFDEEAPEFFRATTENLLRAAERADVRHVVLLSVVGADRVPDVAYYRGKVLQENVVKGGPLPYSIVRATQFMEFVETIAGWTSADDAVRLPSTLLQPVAAEDVVAFLAEVTTGPPRDATLDIAGPDVVPLDELGRRLLRAHRDRREVVTDEEAGVFGAVHPRDAVVTQAPGARLGRVRFEEWLG